MEATLNTEGYKQQLQAKEQQLLKSVRRADTNARDLERCAFRW